MVGPLQVPHLHQSEEQVESKCLQTGVCICSAQGKLLHQVTLRFSALLKETFKQQRGKKLLVDGHVLVCFLFGGAEGSSPFDTIGNASSSSSSLGPCWVSIPLMYLTPYRPTYQLMSPADSPDPISSGTQRRYFKAGYFQGKPKEECGK
eukprot:6486925-Amphidinium_carterae.1